MKRGLHLLRQSKAFPAKQSSVRKTIVEPLFLYGFWENFSLSEGSRRKEEADRYAQMDYWKQSARKRRKRSKDKVFARGYDFEQKSLIYLLRRTCHVCLIVCLGTVIDNVQESFGVDFTCISLWCLVILNQIPHKVWKVFVIQLHVAYFEYLGLAGSL